MSRRSRLPVSIVAVAAVCAFTACAASPNAAVPDRIVPPAPTTTSALPEGWWPSQQNTDTNNQLAAYDDLCADLLDELNRAAPIVSAQTAGAMYGIDVSACLDRERGKDLAVLNQIKPTWDQQCLAANGWEVSQNPFDGPILTPTNSDSAEDAAIGHCATSTTPTAEQCASIQNGLGGHHPSASQSAVLIAIGCPDPSLVAG